MVVMKDQDKRRVNIAWFIGTSKTRFLEISTSHLKVAAVSAGVLLMWSVISLYLVYDLSHESSRLKLSLQDSLATVFDYQSRYDGIYEAAYYAPVTEDREPVPIRVRKTLPVPNLVSTGKGWKLRMQRPIFTSTEKEFSLQFQLENTKKNKKAIGYLWAKANLQKTNGEEFSLLLPAEVTLDDKGVPAVGQRARNYRIKNQKTETFVFALPPDSAGKIAEIVVGMLDTTGRKASYTLPIGINFINPSRDFTVSKSD